MLNEKTNLLIGKSGSGKTSMLFKKVKELITKEENILLLDNKEEYYKTYGKLLKDKGYNVLVLNLKNSNKSNGFNPLSLPYYYYKNGNKDLAITLVNDLAHAMFCSNNANNDPFWENASSDFFVSLTLTLFKEAKEEEINIVSILMMISKNTDDGNIFEQYLKNIEPLNPIYMCGSTTVFAPQETKLSILSVMRQKLNTYLMHETLVNVLCKDEFNLQCLKNKTAIFVIGDTNLNSIANILISELFTLAKQGNYKLNLILDNFDSLPRLNILKDLIDNVSCYNINIYLTIKDLNEMEYIYGKFIFNHFANIINVNENTSLEIGNYNDYPILQKNEIKYFDIKNLK